MNDIPITNESELSPSGRVSNRSERLMKERTRQLLFGAGLEYPTAMRPTERERKKRLAQEYRGLARRGMKPRKHLTLAKQLEKEIDNDAKVK